MQPHSEMRKIYVTEGLRIWRDASFHFIPRDGIEIKDKMLSF